MLRALVRSRLRLALIVVVPTLAALLVAFSGAGVSFDDWLRSERNALRRHAATGEVAVVEIDAASLAQYSRWPWPRSMYGEAVDRLGAAGVELIAFDVDFSSASSPAEDQAFADAIAGANSTIVLPTFRQVADTGSTRIVENLPVPQLREHAFLGSVNVFPDRDGVLRRYRSGITTDGATRPSLASYLSGKPGTASRDLVIDFAIDPATLPHHSFADVLSGKVGARELAGKRVVIGATAIELGDRYASPGYGILPGVITQALAAETLIQGSVNPSLGYAPGLILAIMASLMLVAARRPWMLGPLGLAGGLVLAGLPLLTETLHIGTLPMAPGLLLLTLALAGAALCETLTAFSRTRLTDEESGLPNRAAFVAMDRPQEGVVVTVVFARAEEIASVLTSVSRPELIRLVTQQLAIASRGAQLHRVDAGRYAWLEPAKDPGLSQRLETACALFREPMVLSGQPILLRPSFGLAELEDGVNLGEAYSRATLAAQRAAQTGVAQAHFDPQLAEAATRAQALLGDLAVGMAEGQFWVAYQPKLDLRTRRMIGAEALIRWTHPQHGLVRPDEFIPLLESEGEIENITWHVIHQVMADLRGWSADGLKPQVAVNISTRLFDGGGFAQRMIAAMNAAGLDAGQMTLEVTESAAIGSAQQVVAELTILREAGFKISVDDYGTGQSTLSYLRNFPAHEIKIDQAFIRRIQEDPHDRILVKSTIDLAHALNLKVVAEGIETDEVLDLLEAMRCDVGQGWAIGKPMPGADFITAFQARETEAA